MKTGKLLLITCLALPAAFLPGCTTVNSVENAQPVAQRQMVADKRVLTDASLSRHVNLIGVNSATGPGGFLKIQIELQNITRSAQTFTYRIEWFDENGMLLTLPAANATPRTIEGKEVMDIVAVAPTPRAKDFRIKFLESTN